MKWSIVYFEESDGAVPGEVFEDRLDRSSRQEERGLLNALRRWVQYAAEQGPLGEGGGHFEKCHDSAVWQIKAGRGNLRGRWFFNWDDDEHRLVLLSGIVKEGRQATPPGAYTTAEGEWHRYQQTRQIAKEDE